MNKLILSALAGVTLALTATVANAAVVLTHVPPTNNKPAASTPSDCRDEIGYLRLVRYQQLQDYDAGAIRVYPVCVGSNVSLVDRSNIGQGLRDVMATNEQIVDALADEDFETRDVVGVRFGGGDSLIIYVHRD